MSENLQINMAIPQEWKPQLEQLARLKSVEEEKTLTYLDLIRRAVKKTYKLKDEKN